MAITVCSGLDLFVYNRMWENTAIKITFKEFGIFSTWKFQIYYSN